MTSSEFANTLNKFEQVQVAIVRDDGTSEGRAIVVTPASTVSTELSNTLITVSRGLPFVAVSEHRADSFRLAPMARPRTDPPRQIRNEQSLAMCISVEARSDVTTGISAADRATTIRQLGAAEIVPRSIVHPGHIFPIVARNGGVLVRSALPEAALDIVTLGRSTDAALYFDLLNSEGCFATRAEQEALAHEMSWPIVLLSDLVRYRLENEQLVQRVAEAKLPTILAGELRSFVYQSAVHDGEHVALVKGNIDPKVPVLTRVHQSSTFSDVFGGGADSSRKRLQACLAEIGRNGSGVLVYLRKNGLSHHSLVPGTEGDGLQPLLPSSIMREYGLGAQILRDLGVRRIELLTGSTKNLAGITTFGLEIVSQRPLPLE